MSSRLFRLRPLLNHFGIFGFMVLVGLAIAKALYHQSFMGMLLALVSLGAGVYFLYLLAENRKEFENGDKRI
ncbi:MAG: hypothetical protein ACO25B_12280 [Chitinophagaceae bacterium]